MRSVKSTLSIFSRPVWTLALLLAGYCTISSHLLLAQNKRASAHTVDENLNTPSETQTDTQKLRRKKLLLKLEEPPILLDEEEPNMSVLEQSLREPMLFSYSSDEDHEEITSIEEYLRRIQVNYLQEQDAPLIGYSFSRKSLEAQAADARAEVSTPVFWKEK